jgi:hypothetical protein
LGFIIPKHKLVALLDVLHECYKSTTDSPITGNIDEIPDMWMGLGNEELEELLQKLSFTAAPGDGMAVSFVGEYKDSNGYLFKPWILRRNVGARGR